MIRDRSSIAALVCAILFAACILGMAACGARAVVAGVAPVRNAAGAFVGSLPAPTSTADAEKEIESFMADRRAALDRVELDEQKIKRLEQQRDQLAQADIQRRLSWFRGVVLLGVLVSVALWFILPTGLKSWAVYLGLGCLGAAAAATVLRALVPWLAVIGWIMLALGVAFLLWKLWRFKRAALAGADHADRLETAVLGWSGNGTLHDIVKAVKRESIQLQTDSRVGNVLAAIRGKPKPATLAAGVAP